MLRVANNGAVSRIAHSPSAMAYERLVACLSGDVIVLLALRRLFLRPCVVAERVQPESVLGDQHRRRTNRLRRLLQFILNPINIGKRPPNFFSECDVLTRCRRPRPHTPPRSRRRVMKKHPEN